MYLPTEAHCSAANERAALLVSFHGRRLVAQPACPGPTDMRHLGTLCARRGEGWCA